MTREEFIKQTERLCGLYNKKLNDYQLDFWYESLKDYSLSDYRRGIGEHAMKSKYLPSLAELIEAIRKLHREQPKEEQKVEQVKCDVCHGSGLVKYYKKVGNTDYEYLCKCFCKNGERIDLPIKKYEEVFFYRKPQQEQIPNVDYDVSQINF